MMDTLVCSACTAALLCIGAVGLSGNRAAARRDLCAEKIGRIGAGSARFALSNKDFFAGFTWEPGNPVGTNPATVQQAHADQAVDILRRRGRPDMPAISGWIADVNYWTLVLVDFESRPLSDAFNICPSHDVLNKWRRNPGAFDQGQFLPRQPFPSALERRQPYAGSYTQTGAAFDRNQTAFEPESVDARVAYSGFHSLYRTIGAVRLGPSPISSVAFPSSKVHVFDSNQRHYGGLDLYYAYAESRQPMLFFDGSVNVRVSGDANTPWTPNEPNLPTAQAFAYAPPAWEPGTLSGQSADQVVDRFRWTRDGLLGRDF